MNDWRFAGDLLQPWQTPMASPLMPAAMPHDSIVLYQARRYMTYIARIDAMLDVLQASWAPNRKAAQCRLCTCCTGLMACSRKSTMTRAQDLHSVMFLPTYVSRLCYFHIARPKQTMCFASQCVCFILVNCTFGTADVCGASRTRSVLRSGPQLAIVSIHCFTVSRIRQARPSSCCT